MNAEYCINIHIHITLEPNINKYIKYIENDEKLGFLGSQMIFEIDTNLKMTKLKQQL